MLKINNKSIASDVVLRKGILQCSTGLMFRPKLKTGQAYLFYLSKKKSWGITMFCVFQTIDLLLIDGKKIVGLIEGLKPFMEIKTTVEFDKMVELPSHSIHNHLISKGQIIKYIEKKAL